MNQRYFTLLDKIVLGRAKFQAPFKASSALQDEARFVHIVSGNSRLCSPKHQFDLKTGDSLLMKCEQFVNHWTNEEADRMNEVILLSGTSIRIYCITFTITKYRQFLLPG